MPPTILNGVFIKPFNIAGYECTINATIHWLTVLFSNLSGGGIAPKCDGNGELFHEDWEGAQLAGEDKVEERPQLSEVVLHRRA